MASTSEALVSLALLQIIGLSSAGCREAPRGFQGGPIVSAVDSVILQEPDSAVVGRFANITHDRLGRSYLADLASGRVVRYNRDGTLDRTFGRSGPGPGEFLAAAQPGLLAHDSILAVPDPRQGAFSLFETATGRFLRQSRLPFLDVGRGWTETGDTVVFGLQFSAGLIGRWHWADNGQTTIGAVPPSLVSAGPLLFRYGRIEAVTTSGGYVALLPLDPGLRLFDPGGKPTGRVTLPRKQRRGNDEDLLARQVALEGQRTFEYLGSMAAGLTRLPNGYLAVLMLDVETPEDASSEPTGARYYLTIVKPDFTEACVDGLVPLATDSPLPFPGFVGDTLVALARRVMPDNTVRLVVYRYDISVAQCQWLDTGGIRAP